MIAAWTFAGDHMKPIVKPSLILAAALLCGSAFAQTVNGVRLASLCERCGVVTAVQVEKRKGDASGVGAVGGAVAGGVIGKNVADSTLGTVAGAAIGGLAGHEIEKRVKRRDVWATHVTMKDGSKRRFDSDAKPAWRAGQVVEVNADDRLQRR
jgi:outer membrane lipoprotein SlyB